MNRDKKRETREIVLKHPVPREFDCSSNTIPRVLFHHHPDCYAARVTAWMRTINEEWNASLINPAGAACGFLRETQKMRNNHTSWDSDPFSVVNISQVICIMLPGQCNTLNIIVWIGMEMGIGVPRLYWLLLFLGTVPDTEILFARFPGLINQPTMLLKHDSVTSWWCSSQCGSFKEQKLRFSPKLPILQSESLWYLPSATCPLCSVWIYLFIVFEWYR